MSVEAFWVLNQKRIIKEVVRAFNKTIVGPPKKLTLSRKPCSIDLMMNSTFLAPADFESAKALIDSGAIRHIAMIMDGNRRWAQVQDMPAQQGHVEGYKALKHLVEYCALDLKLPIMTVYAFSTENWRRSNLEVEFLLKLFHKTLQDEIEELIEKNVRLKFLGNLEHFPVAFQEECQKASARTAHNTGMLYQVALNYGGRAEILEACRKLAQQVKQGDIQPEDIQEEHLEALLYTQEASDPDMIIRTGGEYRLSNFLLWQSAYAELCVVDELWPEFSPEVLNRAINHFQNRQRRFGR